MSKDRVIVIDFAQEDTSLLKANKSADQVSRK